MGLWYLCVDLVEDALCLLADVHEERLLADDCEERLLVLEDRLEVLEDLEDIVEEMDGILGNERRGL